MFISGKLSMDISRGCALPAMQPPISATHPIPQHKRTGALAMGLRPEEDHAPLYRERRSSLR